MEVPCNQGHLVPVVTGSKLEERVNKAVKEERTYLVRATNFECCICRSILERASQDRKVRELQRVQQIGHRYETQPNVFPGQTPILGPDLALG